MKITLLSAILAATGTLSVTAAPRKLPFRISPDAPVTERKAKYDYSNYEKIPDTPTCRAYRRVLRAIPYTKERAFWGRWAGSGCIGGTPIDAMDEIFRRHDIVYAEADTLRTMRWADEACVEALRNLDTRELSDKATVFRKRSAAFFSNRRLSLIGKPVGAFFRRHESKDCPFRCRNDVRELFGLEKSVRRKASTPRAHPPPPVPRNLFSNIRKAIF